uniref:DUF433 domain-containing protein n=1 Tax=Candidatus Kentrum sp. DK TaxID=2126562 RepID=A0A450TI73_9GAMM|nr:MAG: Protein of unknown function (DUF433) [Candidatus Kentron sp. DK]VFJ66956.1 MAG: Protein of unknown function (DUF433) [Candidatus Kentron sp. DK]
MRDSVINVDPEVMSGTPVFKDTRVPIETIGYYMADDGGIEEFFDNFPGVSREQVIKLLEEVKEKVLAAA